MALILFRNGMHGDGVSLTSQYGENCGLKAVSIVRGISYTEAAEELWRLRGGYTPELPVQGELESLLGLRFFELKPMIPFKEWLKSAVHCALVVLWWPEFDGKFLHLTVKIGEQLFDNGPIRDMKGLKRTKVAMHVPLHRRGWSNEMPAV